MTTLNCERLKPFYIQHVMETWKGLKQRQMYPIIYTRKACVETNIHMKYTDMNAPLVSILTNDGLEKAKKNVYVSAAHINYKSTSFRTLAFNLLSSILYLKPEATPKTSCILLDFSLVWITKMLFNLILLLNPFFFDDFFLTLSN